MLAEEQQTQALSQFSFQVGQVIDVQSRRVESSRIPSVWEPELRGFGWYSAEIELISATVDALTALGVPGCTIRINDRRLLMSMLDALGFRLALDELHLDILHAVGRLGQPVEHHQLLNAFEV